MKNLFFVFAFLFSFSMYGQTTYTSEDMYVVGDSIALLVLNNQPVNGVMTKYWDNGKLMSEKSYEEGLRVGEFKYYYENGKLEHNIIFEKGVYMSCVGYYKNGKVEHEKDTDQDLQYYKNGKLLGEGNSNKSGERDGLFKYYYKNGHLSSEVNYSDGEFDGLWKMYRRKGELRYEDNYENGDLISEKYYYKNGHLSSEVNYSDGEIVSQKCWDEAGIETPCAD